MTLAALHPPCPKCGEGHLAVIRFCYGIVGTCPDATHHSYAHGPQEHLHRYCTTCGFWTTEPCADAVKKRIDVA